MYVVIIHLYTAVVGSNVENIIILFANLFLAFPTTVFILTFLLVVKPLKVCLGILFDLLRKL